MPEEHTFSPWPCNASFIQPSSLVETSRLKSAHAVYQKKKIIKESLHMLTMHIAFSGTGILVQSSTMKIDEQYKILSQFDMQNQFQMAEKINSDPKTIVV